MDRTFDKKTFFDEHDRKVIRPDDRPIESRPSAYGLVLRNGSLLFSRCAHTGLLDLPGGRIEQGENIDECIAREGLEETWYILRRVSQDPIAVVERQVHWSMTDRYFMCLLLMYSAEVIGEPVPGWKPADLDEVSGVVWVRSEYLLPGDMSSCFVDTVSKFMESQGLPRKF